MKMVPGFWRRWATDPRGVLLLALLLFGWNLWGYDLWAPDEPFFGEGAREMLVDGEWVVPHLNGEVNTHKPPLFFWLIALFSLPVGAVSSLAARLPSVFAALGTLLLTLRLGRRWSGERTALLAGALLATTHMFWDKARWAQIDSLLCFLILAAVSAFEAFRAGDMSGRRAGLVFWAAAALAVLAKGPVGLLLPLGIAVLTLATDGELRKWRRFAPLAGPLVFAAIVGSWAAAATLWGDGYSVVGALREHFVDRAIHGMHHEQPAWYYLKVLPYALLPWSFLLPGALLLAWRRRRPEDRLLLVHGLFVVLFFTVPTEKRDLYILPALPAFSLLTARLVAAVAGWWRPGGSVVVPDRRWVTLPQGIVGAVLVLAAAAVPFVAPRFGDVLLVPAAGLAVVLGAGGLATVLAAVKGSARRSVLWTGATFATAMLVAVSFVYPALNPVKSGRELALAVRDLTAGARAAGRPVLGLGVGVRNQLENVPWAVNLYSDGVYLKDVTDRRQLIAELSGRETVFLLADEATLPPLPEELQRRMSVAFSTRLSRKRLVLLRFAAEPAAEAGGSRTVPASSLTEAGESPPLR